MLAREVRMEIRYLSKIRSNNSGIIPPRQKRFVSTRAEVFFARVGFEFGVDAGWWFWACLLWLWLWERRCSYC
jgi:hypothetical protein